VDSQEGTEVSDTSEVMPDDPQDLGQVDLVDEAEDTTTEEVVEVPDFFDIEQFRDKHVTVKIDGEEIAVPLSEAVAGYQRQADYTRKTQELAQQKAELQWAAAIKGALDHDPAGTIELLAQNFGINVPKAGDSDGDEWVDPADLRYREIEQRLARFEEERAYQQLERTIASLAQKYGDDFDAGEVVAAAMATGSTDLEATFKQIKFDAVMEKARRAETVAAKTQVKTAAKRDAAVVSGGSAAGASNVEVGSVSSIADAWREAKRSLGA
jgi:hypothetical protein